MAQHPKPGLGRPTVEVSRSQTIRHTSTHPTGLLLASDQLAVEAATYTTQETTGFEPAISAVMRLQIYATDGTATGTGLL
jgi:hypothetical protein